ncbi:MAG: sulfatase-like hydrolase/transferase [Bacteroidota bacterium]
MQKLKKSAFIFIFLLMLYALLRVAFYQLYFSKSNISWSNLKMAAYWGWRMDVGAIFYSNIVFFIYYFFLQDLVFKTKKKLAALLLLSVINLPLLAVNVIDLAYYKFNLRRSTVDLFRVIGDSMPALGTFLKAWWWLFVLFMLLSVISVIVFKRILTQYDDAEKDNYIKYSLLPGLCFLLCSGLLTRGFSDRPVIPSTPLLYLPSQYLSLSANSTITVLYSILKRQTTLKEKNYYTASELDTLFTANQQLHPAVPINKMNVVIFILESFAKEYMDEKDPLRAQTPFLDSLMAESIVCNNAYANGLESNKGLVALLGGIPPFFDEPFYYSSYSNNKIRGIGTLLKEEGYSTNFFMGASYDHFGFARFSKMMGIDNYYSMKDYGNDSHYDGNWGIYDHYFLPYAAREMEKKKSPFLSTIFTISTHFPYKLPDTLKKEFTIKGQSAEQNSMSYLDYSLRLFFEVIKKDPWYSNTLFVFSADHNLYWHTQEKSTLYKVFRIPIFFYLPGQKKHIEITKTVQQLDVIPSILDFIHYDKPFMSFGRSIFDSLSPAIAISHFDDLYQGINSSYIFGYNEKTEQSAYLYNFRSDPALKYDLLNQGQLSGQQAQEIRQHLKAVIQYFNYSMIRNKLYIK